MDTVWRRVIGEVGSALGVLSLVVLTLLAPVHATAQMRAELGQPSSGWVLCSVERDGADPAKASALPMCDLCILAQLGHAFGPAAGGSMVGPSGHGGVALAWASAAEDVTLPLRGVVPEARGPPST